MMASFRGDVGDCNRRCPARLASDGRAQERKESNLALHLEELPHTARHHAALAALLERAERLAGQAARLRAELEDQQARRVAAEAPRRARIAKLSTC